MGRVLLKISTRFADYVIVHESSYKKSTEAAGNDGAQSNMLDIAQRNV